MQNKHSKDKNRYKISDLLEQYIKEKPLSPSTIENYRGVIYRLTQDTKIKYINEANFEILLDWRNDVIKRSSDITWNTYLRHSRAIFNFGIKKRVIDENPFSELNWGRRKKNVKKLFTLMISESYLATYLKKVTHFSQTGFGLVSFDFFTIRVCGANNWSH